MTKDEKEALVNEALKMTLEEGDDVLYLGIQHKVKKVWNRGGNRVYYDLEGENPVFQGSKIVQESVFWKNIDLVPTTPSV